MDLVLLTFATWAVAVYSLRLGLLGNPTYELLKATPVPMLRRATVCLEEAETPDDSDLQAFLRELYRLKLTRGAVFLLEAGSLFYLLVTDPAFPIAWFVAAKNIWVYAMVYQALRAAHDDDNLQAILDCPDAVRRWDRLNQLLNGGCFLVLMLRVQGIL